MSDSESDPEVLSDAGQVEARQSSVVDRVTVGVLRAMLALNNTNTPIHKNNLKKIGLKDESIPSRFLDGAIIEAQKILYEVYGYQLKELPLREITNAQGKTSLSKTKQWILVSALEDRYLRFIQESNWLRTSNYLFESELLDERGDYRGSKERCPTLSSDAQLLAQGLALTIVALIVVNNNHMTETDLTEVLRENFGFRMNSPLEILHMLPVDFFKLLEKQEYVYRTVIKNDGDEIVEYKIGRRALLEFDRDSFVELVKILYDEPEDNPQFVKMIDSTIESAYGKRADEAAEIEIVANGE